MALCRVESKNMPSHGTEYWLWRWLCLKEPFAIFRLKSKKQTFTRNISCFQGKIIIFIKKFINMIFWNCIEY